MLGLVPLCPQGWIRRRYTYRGVEMEAHRASWLIHRGPIPKGIHVLHRCDVPGCVNPDHLFLGTHLENVGDMVAKGRQCVGEKNGGSKLTTKDVLDIRSARSRGESLASLSARFGVRENAISRIATGKRWGHVKNTEEVEL